MVGLVADVADPQTKQGAARLLAVHSLSDFVGRAAAPASLLDTQPLLYFDSPNIVISRIDGGSAGSEASRSFDLHAEGLSHIEVAAGFARGTRRLLRRSLRSCARSRRQRWVAGDETPGGVGGLFEAAQEHHVTLRMVAPGTQPAAGLPTPDGVERAGADLKKGRLLIVPGVRPEGWSSSLGWWSVDRVTGSTEDTTEDGNHWQLVDYGKRVKDTVVRTCKNYKLLGVKAAAVGLHVAAVFAGDPGTAAGLDGLGSAADGVASVCGGSVKVPPTQPPKPPGGISGPAAAAAEATVASQTVMNSVIALQERVRDQDVT